MSQEFYRVGKIVNTQGLKGEVRVIATTDFPEKRFQPGSQLVIFDHKNIEAWVEVVSHRQHKNFHILSFKGMTSINDVEGFKGMEIMVAAKERHSDDLAEGEFFYDQIIGLVVYDLTGKELGKVKTITQLGPNDVWTIQRNQPGKKDVLIPYIDDVVKSIDLDDKKIVIDALEGLIDDEG
ncbi:MULTISPECIES: ribosome maturation factor RimM [Aerococcus]|uniref:ribosome maturation factor RimM n=1 Tax=Aerococcus urinae (strain CCUG 59500 / ACS-120-V-Col10a) TaxID=2976812 RepID=UPI000200E568|nr:ribosome maturation factor RimM [Aerococcus sp. Group 1]AEA01169.1 16S rRNA processing protein RimM [Aerococcus sp. Group 1]MCY3030212.1 ribosome maturation factor RimM [Aerococcus sp. Group 1]MCY3054587.1 ribosome maturation factor RimM [Aerococcus sp. Group 1]MCY3056317.1 ribosome maturation factor RimM [Aerococcus sp. Group 1]MCY3062489.1 ribosome maturation factor RimM [Aerococcus sp. Group 1]